MRQEELELDDLLFFIYPSPGSDEPHIPRDYLLQLHVAVCNVCIAALAYVIATVGDRKAVLSAIKLDGFLNERKETMHLPEATAVIEGRLSLQRSGWTNGRHHFETITVPPPYVLEPDDVITLRFRIRRGIDWSPRWTLAELQRFSEALDSPIVRAYGRLVWRRGDKLRTDDFQLPIVATQQAEFREALASSTKGFTSRPDIPLREIDPD